MSNKQYGLSAAKVEELKRELLSELQYLETLGLMQSKTINGTPRYRLTKLAFELLFELEIMSGHQDVGKNFNLFFRAVDPETREDITDWLMRNKRVVQ
jgi:hypothetical protein